MGSAFLMLLTASFLFFCFLKFAREKGFFLHKCLLFVLLLSPIVYWHFNNSEDIYYTTSSIFQSNEVRQPPIIDTNKSEPASPSLKFPSHDKWIVVTSISNPTQQIEKLSQIPGWKLVVVADKKTPSNWTHPNTILLDLSTQLSLGYRIVEHLPWNSYTRKVIGYLFAIQNGATVIYDTDDDNAPNEVGNFNENFDLSPTTTRGLVMTKGQDHVKNPYKHFGQGSIWPRGFPLDKIGQDYNTTYALCPLLPTPLIQQGLVNGDPDVDAIFRLTRKKLHSPINVVFDGYAPPAIYPPGLFAPFNSQNTIFHYAAFWGLLLPTSVAFRVTDIWRGYWVQPLLWRVGGTLGFYSPHTTQLRNAHVYLKDFGEEDQMYKQTWDLIQLLSSWECSSPGEEVGSIYNCMSQLTEAMVAKKMWSKDEVPLVKAWIEDLKSVGYKPPGVIISQNSTTSSSPCRDESFATFNGVTIPSPDEKEEDSRIELREFCNFTMDEGRPNTSTINGSTSMPRTVLTFPSTLLLVTFNIPHYRNIWLLDLIYRPHYPNILYCGQLSGGVSTLQNLTSSREFTDAGVTQFSFLHANVSNGVFAYECAVRAIEMNYGVTEYIVLSDDILLNFWNNVRFSRDEIWAFRDHVTLRNLENPYNSTEWNGWVWWRSGWGLNATKKAVQEIYASTHPAVEEFVKNRSTFGFNSSIAMYGESDVFYLPRGKQEAFYEVAKILRESQVFLEIAVPYLLSGLSSPEKSVNISASWLWGDRDKALSFFNVSSSVIHPVKLSLVIGDEKTRREYCDKYVHHILEME